MLAAFSKLTAAVTASFLAVSAVPQAPALRSVTAFWASRTAVSAVDTA